MRSLPVLAPTLVTTTTTDANGHYNFGGLCPGDYTVSFNTPAGYGHTIAHSGYANNANPPSRVYPVYTKDPELNFPQEESYANRLLGRYTKEQEAIDVIMFRISDERESNAVIAAVQHIHIDQQVVSYAVRVTAATRQHPAVRFGASPRGSVGLVRAANDGLSATSRVRCWPSPVTSSSIVCPAFK